MTKICLVHARRMDHLSHPSSLQERWLCRLLPQAYRLLRLLLILGRRPMPAPSAARQQAPARGNSYKDPTKRSGHKRKREATAGRRARSAASAGTQTLAALVCPRPCEGEIVPALVVQQVRAPPQKVEQTAPSRRGCGVSRRELPRRLGAGGRQVVPAADVAVARGGLPPEGLADAEGDARREVRDEVGRAGRVDGHGPDMVSEVDGAGAAASISQSAALPPRARVKASPRFGGGRRESKGYKERRETRRGGAARLHSRGEGPRLMGEEEV
eukprot:CAMPEP_0177599274 /NCGR_PEP_ID=MMETSP0419_2-20121207/12889_1 /TAXON_ID=582737 /ORGANISM="Tetraselmis sp., Strain GSL018" /LENGTH=270 /DNA_ID=CAMNT_0019091963 /DNA_START=44 /DNA_END=858 /DNA_ORIENTATION=-